MTTVANEKDRKMHLENLDELEKLNGFQESWMLEKNRSWRGKKKNSKLCPGQKHYPWLRISLMVAIVLWSGICIIVIIYGSDPAYFQEAFGDDYNTYHMYKEIIKMEKKEWKLASLSQILLLSSLFSVQ